MLSIWCSRSCGDLGDHSAIELPFSMLISAGAKHVRQIQQVVVHVRLPSGDMKREVRANPYPSFGLAAFAGHIFCCGTGPAHDDGDMNAIDLAS